MMLDAESMAALLEAFLAESTEGLAQAEEALLVLERAPEDEEALAVVFRVAHTIKGNAGMFDLAPVCAVTHAIEDYLDQIRQGRARVTDEVVSELLEAVDLLRVQLRECLDGRKDLNPSEKTLIGRFERRSATSPTRTGHRPTNSGGSPSAPAIEQRKESSLRVDLATLDRLLDLSGEIGIARGRVTQMIEDLSTARKAILEAQLETNRLHLEMQDLVMRLRMVPIRRTFRQLARTVRDVARSVGKAAELQIEGDDVAVDMSVVEHLKDPLVHMIRNGIDHGIELPEERKAAGKEPVGRLVLSATREAGSIVIELRDDGAGLDHERILRRARDLGLVDESESLTAAEIEQIIFRAGFSTSDEVTDLSGRGVGMDVVRKNIEAVHGTLSVESVSGRGTTIRIRLPLTLAIVEGLLVEIAGEIYIVPMEAVVEVLDASIIGSSDEPEGFFDFRERVVPWFALRHHLGYAISARPRRNLVVVNDGKRQVGFVVDSVRGESQTVVKPLARTIQGIRGFSGSSILPDGRIAFILDLPAIISQRMDSRSRPAARPMRPASDRQVQPSNA